MEEGKALLASSSGVGSDGTLIGGDTRLEIVLVVEEDSLGTFQAGMDQGSNGYCLLDF